MHTALLLGGTAHAPHEVPQVAVLVSLAHTLPQR